MEKEKKRFSINPEKIIFVTTSPFRIAQLEINGLGKNHYSRIPLQKAITTAEENIDSILKVGLFAEIPSYPILPAMAKALATIDWLNNDRNYQKNGRPFFDEQLFAVADSTWVINNIYFNKPKSHLDGSVIGVREVYNHLVASAGKQARNESVLVIFTIRGIEEIYMFNLEVGQVRRDIGTISRKDILKILFKGRHIISAGLDSSDGINSLIFDYFPEMPLTVFKITVNNVSGHNNDNFSDLNKNPREFLSSLVAEQIATKMIPSSDINKIRQVILGTITPNFTLEDN